MGSASLVMSWSGMGPDLSGRWCYRYIGPATLGALNVPLSEHSLYAYLAVEDGAVNVSYNDISRTSK